MHFYYRNVNVAYNHLIRYFKDAPNDPPLQRSESRNGDVIRFVDPFIMTFEKPKERILTDEIRDCNIFFHLYESLWMLYGGRDVASLTQFLPTMADYSDNGYNFWGAYGHRWRHFFSVDQIKMVIEELSRNQNTRRAVLQMWDGATDLDMALRGGKDVPCNLSALFEIVDNNKLNMTVFNRSNDLIWGALGANYFHFTILQEYIAAHTFTEVGKYHQVSNNSHVYLNAQFEKLTTNLPEDFKDPYEGKTDKGSPLIRHKESLEVFSQELAHIVNNPYEDYKYKSTFLADASRAFQAFTFHKTREYDEAFTRIYKITDYMLRNDCYRWLKKRETYHAKKSQKTS